MESSIIINLSNGFSYEKETFTSESDVNDFFISLRKLGIQYKRLDYKSEEERDKDFIRIEKALFGVYKDLILTK
jgi:hypothetical protein